MAVYYVKSGATGLANGATWTDAYTTLGACVSGAGLVDGDIVYVSHQHAETPTTTSLDFPVTVGDLIKVICVNDAAEPPTTIASTATVTTSGAINYDITGNVYMYGIAFSGYRFLLYGFSSSDKGYGVFENCSFDVTTYLSIGVSGVGPRRVVFKDTDVTFQGVGDYILIRNDRVDWEGGSIAGTGVIPTNVFDGPSTDEAVSITMRGVDMSNINTTLYDASTSGVFGMYLDMVGCKLHADLTIPNQDDESVYINLRSCGTGNEYYKHEYHSPTGLAETDVAIYGSATYDGTNGYSWKMTSKTSANEFVKYVSIPLTTIVEVDFTTTKTFTIECARDGSTTPYQDDE